MLLLWYFGFTRQFHTCTKNGDKIRFLLIREKSLSMAQKTLFAFFKRETTEAPRKEVKACSPDGSLGDDSPVKTTNNKKRQRIESSSSDGSKNSDEESTKEKTTNITSPNKKSYIKKLAKFSASPRKEKQSVLQFKSDDSQQQSNSTEAKVNKNENVCQPNEEKSISTVVTKAEEVNNSAILKEAEPQKQKTVSNFFAPKSTTTKSDDNTESKSISSDNAYDPSSAKYHPIDDACWKKGEKVPYYALARTLDEIEKVSARLKMIAMLSNYLRSVLVLTPEDFLPSVYLCLNKLGAANEGLELGLAEQTLIRAISQSTGRTVTQIRNEIQETGDLGLVAERSRSSQRLMLQPAALTVSGIFKKFKEIAAMTGQTAVNKKISIIQSLFVACKGPEAKFVIRSLNGKLRIGLAEQSVLQAIALACATTPPCQTFPPEKLNVAKTMSTESFKSHVDELALILKTTYCECPNYDAIVPVMLKEGIMALPKHCKITPGLPMKPMLAQPTKGVEEVLTRFDGLEFTCEWKYDGERAQIHCSDDGVIKIFSRNQEDNTSKYPDIVSRITNTRKEGVKSFILDCEAVAWDREEKRILPFQILSTRKRKDADESSIKVQVCCFMFDLLYLNGEPLVKEKFYDRRRFLHENFNEVDEEWKFATAIDTSKMEEVQEFLEESIKGNCEGLMVKTLKEEATYEIAKRSRNWLKLKKDYLEGVGDTLDLVVLGGYFGKGKRTGAYGGFLVGCYDEDNEQYQSLCKIGTGFSDESLAAHAEFFKNHLISNAPAYYQYDASLEPDDWFEPIQVWEIKCADLSLSPIHRAAIGLIDPEKGVSLRFPRFLRIRDDKKPEAATTAQQIVDMYQNQEQVKNQQKKNAKFDEETFY